MKIFAVSGSLRPRSTVGALLRARVEAADAFVVASPEYAADMLGNAVLGVPAVRSVLDGDVLTDPATSARLTAMWEALRARVQA
ncbi:hypothetical protein AB0I28_03115 [Phytomonospora sp. NPDC050363]|uniref:hypothetical protein n=1 Tax=Phytomonospora sp. NPDC050363 TaxID=3155642 RepID=UPI0033FBF6BC